MSTPCNNTKHVLLQHLSLCNSVFRSSVAHVLKSFHLRRRLRLTLQNRSKVELIQQDTTNCLTVYLSSERRRIMVWQCVEHRQLYSSCGVFETVDTPLSVNWQSTPSKTVRSHKWQQPKHNAGLDSGLILYFLSSVNICTHQPSQCPAIPQAPLLLRPTILATLIACWN